jgi:hypothetical protein
LTRHFGRMDEAMKFITTRCLSFNKAKRIRQRFECFADYKAAIWRKILFVRNGSIEEACSVPVFVMSLSSTKACLKRVYDSCLEACLPSIGAECRSVPENICSGCFFTQPPPCCMYECDLAIPNSAGCAHTPMLLSAANMVITHLIRTPSVLHRRGASKKHASSALFPRSRKRSQLFEIAKH